MQAALQSQFAPSFPLSTDDRRPTFEPPPTESGAAPLIHAAALQAYITPSYTPVYTPSYPPAPLPANYKFENHVPSTPKRPYQKRSKKGNVPVKVADKGKTCLKAKDNLGRGQLQTGKWSESEIRSLRCGIKVHGRDWVLIASTISTRTREQVKNKGYAMILERETPNKCTGHWKEHELKALISGMEQYGVEWKKFAATIPSRSWSQMVRKGKHLLDDREVVLFAAWIRRGETPPNEFSSFTTTDLEGTIVEERSEGAAAPVTVATAKRAGKKGLLKRMKAAEKEAGENSYARNYGGARGRRERSSSGSTDGETEGSSIQSGEGAELHALLYGGL